MEDSPKVPAHPLDPQSHWSVGDGKIGSPLYREKGSGEGGQQGRGLQGTGVDERGPFAEERSPSPSRGLMPLPESRH